MSRKFKAGYEYADSQLRLGVTVEELEKQADNPFDFDDFDRGMIGRLKAREVDNEY